ncbi:helix-turn-helix domain-containing protein [Pseudomonas sp. PGPR40]
MDTDLRNRITIPLNDGKSIREVAHMLECSTTTVQRVKATL